MMKIRVFREGKIIRVFHSPQNVIVKPKAKIVELYDGDGILTESYSLIDGNGPASLTVSQSPWSSPYPLIARMTLTEK